MQHVPNKHAWGKTAGFALLSTLHSKPAFSDQQSPTPNLPVFHTNGGSLVYFWEVAATRRWDSRDCEHLRGLPLQSIRHSLPALRSCNLERMMREHLLVAVQMMQGNCNWICRPAILLLHSALQAPTTGFRLLLLAAGRSRHAIPFLVCPWLPSRPCSSTHCPIKSHLRHDCLMT